MKSRARGVDGSTFMEAAVRQLLAGVGEDVKRDGLKDTPSRVARALLEMTSGYDDDPRAILRTTFRESYDEMVVVRGIAFWSMCEHHMLPFHGTATVGYLPRRGRVVGLSKLARLVHCFSRRLQIQERLTEQVADALQTNLRPRGVGVVMRATHLCMACRGVKTPAEMVTSRLMGRMRTSPTTRAEFLALERG